MSFTEVIRTDSAGLQIVHKHDTSQTMTLKGSGKPICWKEIERLRQYLTPESVFVDVGANIGSFTLSYAPHVKRVIAFEAQRIFAYMLSGSVALNGLMNVWVRNYALGSKQGVLPIPQYDLNQVLAYGSVEFGREQKEHIGQVRQLDNPDDLVLMESLDNLMHDPESPELGLLELDRVDVMKIDVEGMELQVLDGAELAIKKFRPVMLIEYCKCGKQPLHLWLLNHDYEVEDLGMDFLGVPK